MYSDRDDSVVTVLKVLLFSSLCAIIMLFVPDARYKQRPDEVSSEPVTNAVTAQWHYQQLKMTKCTWCGRTTGLNRHHAIPQSANPALRDDKDNLIVLCRDCHFVLGHRCNWKQYNPDVVYICTQFTNCVKSADTRNALGYPEKDPEGTAPVQGREPADAVPEKQRAALDRIMNETEDR